MEENPYQSPASAPKGRRTSEWSKGFLVILYLISLFVCLSIFINLLIDWEGWRGWLEAWA
jgi:hypothetical protein